jgi:hypothetical protein
MPQFQGHRSSIRERALLGFENRQRVELELESKSKWDSKFTFGTGGLKAMKTGRQEDRKTGRQEDRKTGRQEDRKTALVSSVWIDKPTYIYVVLFHED